MHKAAHVHANSYTHAHDSSGKVLNLVSFNSRKQTCAFLCGLVCEKNGKNEGSEGMKDTAEKKRGGKATTNV